jgi:uncharacterized damage-inducible protein DinB
MSDPKLPEPWLRGTSVEVPAVARGVLHAFELAAEDLKQWCGSLTDEEINARPAGLAPVAFHLRHIARSIDRLLTYAEGRPLDETQTDALKTELDADARRSESFAELTAGLASAAARVRAIAALGAAHLEERREVGKRQLPTTVGGLLVHVADHTQRHVGQAITTAKIAIAGRGTRTG